MKSSDYWRKREEKWIKQQIKEDAKQSKIIAEKYQKALDQIEKEISANWERFAGKEGVTLSDAKKMALEMDVKAFARKAKEYVDTKDFSKTANDELRLYNVTMRTNRLELLKSQIGLELIALSDEVDKYTAETLTKTGLKEAERQAGILGETVFSNYKTFVESVAFGSFQGATFSERIWGNNGALKADLDRLLIRGVTQGRNPRELARELRTLFDSSKYEAERLMRTETARVQVAIQEKSYQEYGIEEFEFVAEPSACGLCKPLDGKTFKVSKMTVGLNAPPIHPHCRCSTVPAIVEEVDKSKLAANSIKDNEDIKKRASAEEKLQSELDILKKQESQLNDKKLKAKLLDDLQDKWDEDEISNDEFYKRQKEIMDRFSAKKNPEIGLIQDKIKAKKDELTRLQEANAYENADTIKSILGQYRKMGIGDVDLSKHFYGSSAEYKKYILDAYDRLPTDWVRCSVEYGKISGKFISRGYYDHYASEKYANVMLSSRSGEKNPFRTAIHELLHRQENIDPAILKAEEEFYKSRTAGEALQRLADVAGAGYKSNEVTRVDHFINPYMGKDYKGKSFELLTMGADTLYTRPQDLMKDEDMLNWVIKMLLS